jgi:murein DD-endopeptidase MepM/ murein hydrolase activator NlpD
MLNYGTAIQATETSMNSFNSATREQDKYSESLQARINRLSTAWTNFANTAGDTVIYDTIVVVTEALSKAANGGSGFISTIGLLGPALGIASAAVVLLSTKLRTFIITTYQSTAATVKATGATGAYAVALTSLGTAATVAKHAIRGLAVATIIGAVFVGVGIALEKVINLMSEATQKQEEYENYLKSNTAALTENRENTMQLVNAYKTLSAQDSSAWDSEKEQEYLKVQQQLGEIFPALIDHIDSTGQAHLKKGELLTKEIEATERLVEAQNKLTVDEAAKDFEELNKVLSGGMFSSWSNFWNGNLKEQVESMRIAVDSIHAAGISSPEQEFALLQLEEEYRTKSEEIKGHIFKVVDAIHSLNDVEIDSTLKSNVENFVDALDTSNLDEQGFKDFAENVADIMEKMQKALSNEDSKGYSNAVAELNELASTTENFDPKVNSLSDSLLQLLIAVNKNAEAYGFAAEEGDEYGDSVEGMDSAFKELTDSISYVNGVLEDYAENNTLSADTLMELVEEYPQLLAFVDDEAQLIKELTNIRDQDINAAKLQLADKLYINEDFYKKNLSALQKFVNQQFSFYKGDLEQWETLAQAKADVETALINKLAAQWAIYYSKTTQQFAVDNWAVGTEFGQQAVEANRQLLALRSGFEEFTLDRINLDFTSLGTSLGKNSNATKNNTSERKKNNDATKESIYYTDKYKQKIDELTLAIEKQKNIQSKYPDYHDKYIKATETQLKLEREKLRVMEEQRTSLDKQIKSGKIKETGTVQTVSGTKTTSTNRNLSGWGGTITDTYGTYRSFRNGRMHTGVDIAGKKGTILESNVNGKVIGRGSNSLSGNWIKILDNNGLQHFYGHLSEFIAQMGQVVEVGTKIGKIGNTGNVYSRTGDGSHLHYEIKRAGKNINPIEYVKAAKKNQTVTTTSGGKSASTLAAETAKSIDDAKAALNAIDKEILNQQELIAELEKSVIDSRLSKFESKRKFFEDSYNYEEAKIKNVNKTSDRYNATISKQIDLLAKKRKEDKQELAYIDRLLKKGGLSVKVTEELKARQRALNTSIQETTSSIAELKGTRISNNEIVSEQQASLIEYMSQAIESLTVGTDRYNDAVNDKIGYMKKQLAADEAQLNVEKQKIISGQYTGEALDAIIEKVNTLTLSTMALAKQIQDENYNLVVSIKVKTDEFVDDNNFEIERSKLMQSLMVEGSANWVAESEKQIQWLMQNLEAIDKQRHDMQQELYKPGLSADQIKQITEDLEDLTIAYWNTKNAIENTNKEIENIEKSLLEDIYNDLLNAYKDYIGERRDEHMKAIDDELEAEQKAHDERLKMLEDELDAFKNAADEKLRILERTESERDYNMEIDELTTQRTKIQEQINRLSLENTNEAKAKRKKLQEELDKIDKDIAEKRHDRDIELQKQAITDSVEAKEEEIAEKQELEDVAYDKVVKRIDKEKKYWEKHYNDLLNDERKFAQLREDVMSKNFANISTEFSKYITEMEATMPQLKDTLDGTMKAVGTSIRLNVIDNLKDALALIDKYNAKKTPGTPGIPGADGTPGGENPDNPSVTDPHDPNKDKENLVDNAPPPAKTFSDADMKVLLAKYMKEQLVHLETIDRRKKEIRRKADVLAAEGRAEGSTVSKDVGLNEILSGYPKDQVYKFSQFAIANKSVVMSDYLQKHITEFAKKIASMDTGGYINTKGTGIDGKGGALSIVHPHEVILDKVDTKSLINNIGVMDNMVQAFKNTFANIKASSLLPSLESGQQIVVEVTGDNYYNNGQDADKVFNKIVDGIRRKGGRL